MFHNTCIVWVCLKIHRYIWIIYSYPSRWFHYHVIKTTSRTKLQQKTSRQPYGHFVIYCTLERVVYSSLPKPPLKFGNGKVWMNMIAFNQTISLVSSVIMNNRSIPLHCYTLCWTMEHLLFAHVTATSINWDCNIPQLGYIIYCTNDLTWIFPLHNDMFS